MSGEKGREGKQEKRKAGLREQSSERTRRMGVSCLGKVGEKYLKTRKKFLTRERPKEKKRKRPRR